MIVGALVGVTVPELGNEKSCSNDTGELSHLPSRNQSVEEAVCAELPVNSSESRSEALAAFTQDPGVTSGYSRVTVTLEEDRHNDSLPPALS